jgi:threonine/homoserine/homoserine lactone efflux protein
MDLVTFFRGAVIGLSIGAPLGPVGLICLRRMLNQGAVSGLVSGLGAATADALYGAVTGFGLTVLTGPLVRHEGWLRVAGGIVLCAIGVRCAFAHPKLAIERGARTGLLRAYVSVLLLTLTSPATVISFLAIFTALGAVGEGGRLSVGLLVAGVFAGSAFWWVLLAGGTGALHHHVTPRGLTWVNRLSGALIAAFGVAVLAFGVDVP